MDIETFVEVVAKHLTSEQMTAILDIFTSVDPIDHCLACGVESVPVDEQGRAIGKDNANDFDRYEYHHKEGCPVQVLINWQSTYQVQEA